MSYLRTFLFPLLMIAGLLVSGFVIVNALSAAPAQPATIAVTAPALAALAGPDDKVGHGRALFVAKGCIVCHRNDRVQNLLEGIPASPNQFGVASEFPNLTTVKADPEYLKRWLANPSALKPNTEMPNLGLSEAEIDALVAFLTEGK